MSLTADLARWAAKLRYEDLPPDVVAHAKRAIADTILVAHAAAGLPDVQAVRAQLVEEGGRSTSRAWLSDDRLTAQQAAFLNALAASALDYDGLNNGVHADVVSLPAAFAVAESQQSGGRELLTAFVVGSEIIARLRDATIGISRGWSYNSALGVFGAAAAAAKLLALDEAGIAHAMGIALAQAAGTQQANVEQVLLKRMQTAFAARAGVFSALLAQSGIDGPALALEGPFGFAALYQPLDEAAVLDGLGNDYRVLNTVFKKFPVCACSHPAIAAMLGLVTQNNILPDEVTGIELTITPFMKRLVGGDFEPAANPQVTAQFSVRYNIASILARRHLGIAEIQPDAVLDPRVGALASAIRLRVDPNRQGGYGPVSIGIDTARGRFEATSPPYLPILSARDHDAKRRDCLAQLDRKAQPAVARTLKTIEKLESFPDIRRVLSPAHAFEDAWSGNPSLV